LARTVGPKDIEMGREKIGAQWRAKHRQGKFTITVYSAKPDWQSNRDFFNAGADRIMHTVPSEEPEKTRELLERWAGEVG
jgi:hypothetical protein